MYKKGNGMKNKNIKGKSFKLDYNKKVENDKRFVKKKKMKRKNRK